MSFSFNGRVVLINPAVDSCESASSVACFPPLGLLSLASHVVRGDPEIKVRIVDQSVTPYESILGEFVGGTIVGISSLTTTYRNALRFAYQAKEAGCFVVMGNDHASRFGEEIVRHRPVDAVIVGDHAEVPFSRLVASLKKGRRDLSNICGIVYRLGKTVVARPPERYAMSQLPIVDRTLIDHDPYARSFNEKFGAVLGKDYVPTTANLCRGCAKGKNRCSFCDIYDLTLDRVHPSRAWEELMYLQGLGYNYIWEVGDSFTSQGPWLRSLHALRPEGFEGDLFVYARAQELVRIETVLLLRALGVTRVNIGMESGHDEALIMLNKGNVLGALTNRKAARNLVSAGIKAHVSLILGSPGENESSLQSTIELVNWLLSLGVLTSVDPSILYPLPGAPLWRLVKECEEFSDALYTDLLPEDLRERFARKFCSVPFDRLVEARDLINKMAVDCKCVPGGFG